MFSLNAAFEGQRSAPEFIKQVHDVNARVGDPVKLRCKVKGMPHPRVQWFKDGHRLTNSEHYKIGTYSRCT